MWWEERYWLLLDVEWEAGRQKQGSPGYCCSVGGYRQPGSPHDTVAGLRGRWTGLPLSLSLSLQLTLHAPFPVPVVLFLLPFFFFSLLRHQHNLSLSADISPHNSQGPSTLFLCGFSSAPLPRRPPTLWSWMEVSELDGGLEERPFLHRLGLSTAPCALEYFLYLLPPTCQLSFTYWSHHAQTAHILVMSLTFPPILTCLSLCPASFDHRFVRHCFMPVLCCYLYCLVCVCVVSCSQCYTTDVRLDSLKAIRQ